MKFLFTYTQVEVKILLGPAERSYLAFLFHHAISTEIIEVVTHYSFHNLYIIAAFVTSKMNS
jgi:hypothetical protein